MCREAGWTNRDTQQEQSLFGQVLLEAMGQGRRGMRQLLFVGNHMAKKLGNGSSSEKASEGVL